ncbi:PRELI-like family-domain-containing protein [Syncephalis plumigaleata]|nr:PRELI-like family-domain-containing protein [Syncephalis plumigaleata]
MKLFSSTHLYDWDQVTTANWLKYPNPNCAHVVHVDILDRRVDPDTGILHTERLITCKQPIPAFFRRILGASDLSFAREISYVDPVGRVHTSITWNLSLRDMMTVEERCDYRVATSDCIDPETRATNTALEDRTVFVQEARISALGSLSRLAGRVEDFALTRFGENAAIGRRGFEWVLERLWKEGAAMKRLGQAHSLETMIAMPLAATTTTTTDTTQNE